MKLPQLALRDLFWLVLVAALGCTWWVREDRMGREMIRLSHKVRSLQREIVLRPQGGTEARIQVDRD